MGNPVEQMVDKLGLSLHLHTGCTYWVQSFIHTPDSPIDIGRVAIPDDICPDAQSMACEAANVSLA